ncbi:MAG: SAM-dependent chlorinase/fluorinase [Bacteroidota bacterium]
MPVITLTTDLGLKDHYVSAIKGSILSQLPEAGIVDITHLVPPFGLLQAAYILKNAFPHFPSGTVHIIGVNAEGTLETPHIGVLAQGHYFIGADNGIFSFLFDRVPEKIVELNLKQDTDVLTFPTRDIFTKAACHLARGGTLEVIGRITDKVNTLPQLQPAFDTKSIRGSVMYIDSYNNIICNISKELFRQVGKGRPFLLNIRNLTIDTVSERYSDVPSGEVLALFNSSGFLEIAQSMGALSRLENISINEMVTIQFA